MCVRRYLAFVVIANDDIPWVRELSWVCLTLLLNERFTKVSHSANKWCFHLGLNAITICYRSDANFFFVQGFNNEDIQLCVFMEMQKRRRRGNFLIDFIISNLISFYALARNFFDLINNHAHTPTKLLLLFGSAQQ